MPWKCDIPPFPKAITDTKGSTLNRQTRQVWEACHTLLNAINEWEKWLAQARDDHRANRRLDAETGDEIAQAGRTAIGVLRGLDVRHSAFSPPPEGEDDNLIYFWPTPPSDLLDPEWYVTPNDPLADEMIGEELFHSRHVLAPGVEELLRLLAKSPEAVLTEQIRVDLDSSQVIVNGEAYSVGPDAADILDAIVRADGSWVSGSLINPKAYRILKNKKMPDAVRNLIEAAPGRGYRLRKHSEK